MLNRRYLTVSVLCLLMLTLSLLGLASCFSGHTEHTYDVLKYDADSHWYECTCGAKQPDSDTAHSGGTATATQKAVCSVCNQAYGEVLGEEHKYDALKYDTTHHWYECDCGDKKDVAEHTWNEGIVTKNPTETEKGTKQFTCTLCAVTKEVELPTVAHVHNMKKTEEVKATCEAAGAIAYWNCEGCDLYFSDAEGKNALADLSATVIPAIEHRNETLTQNVPAKCGVAGKDIYTCPDCSRVREETIDALEHNWVDQPDLKVEASCAQAGYSVHKCSRCQIEERYNEVPKGDCNYVYTVTTPASCQASGLGTYTCSGCGDEYTEVIPQEDHSYVETVVERGCETGGYTLHTCSKCGNSYRDNETESYGGHAWVDDAENSVEKTCTVAGVDAEKCERCDATRTTPIPATGHSYVDPTCDADGYCSVCNATGAPKLGHTWEEKSELNLAPTCDADGYVYYECSVCGSHKTETPASYNKTGHNESEITWDETEHALDGQACTYYTESTGVCPDCGQTVTKRGENYVSHSYTCAITQAATCTTSGVKTYTCSCSHSYTENYTETNAHTWDAGVTANGVTTYTCIHNAAHTKTAVAAKEEVEATIPSDVLNNAEEVELKDATMILDQTTKDQLGGDDVSISAGILDETERNAAISNLTSDELELLGDSNIFNFTMSQGDTLITEFDGKIKVRVRYDLNGEDPENIVIWYISESVPVLVEAKYIEIDGLGYAEFETNHFSYYTVTRLTAKQRCEIYGHNTENSTTVIMPTCLTGGYTLTVCRRCGEKTITERTVALGHTWVLEEHSHTEVSCDTDGYAKYACHCGTSYEIVEPAYGHVWEYDEEQSASPTCSTIGSSVYVCHCGESYSETIAMLEHEYQSTVTAPTCTESGYTTYVCVTCGHTYTADRVAALGHNITDLVHEATCLAGGYTEHWCETCGEVFANTDITEKADHAWNREAPDCENDMICTVCATRHPDGKAHGHSMKLGSCEYCGKPCEHTYRLSHTVDPTCSEKGYTVSVCDVCRLEKRDNETATVAHSYQHFTDVPATCQSSAYTVEICSVCGDEKRTAVGQPIDHTFENGVCTVCGLSSNSFYLNIIESWKNINGASVELSNLSYVLTMANGTGEITQVETAYLMLRENANGKLEGAMHGSFRIVSDIDGVQNDTAEFKVIVEDGTAYIFFTYTELGVAQENYVKADAQELVNEMFGMDSNEMEEMTAVVDMLLEGNIDGLLKKIVSGLIGDLEEICGDLIGIVFNEESTEAGTVFTLDFAKLAAFETALNEQTVSELIDTYFGEGFFENLKTKINAICSLKVPAVIDYLALMGVTEEEFITAANLICTLMGAPEEFDFADVLTDEQYAELTLGEILFADADYQEEIDALISAMELSTLSDLNVIDANLTIISEMVAYIGDSLTFSFTADANGMIAEINLVLNNLVINEGDGNSVALSANVKVTPNGEIEITWQDIVENVENIVVIPEMEDELGEIQNGNYYHNNGTINYNDIIYMMEEQYMSFYRYSTYYSDVKSVQATPDCSGWFRLSYSCTAMREKAAYSLFVLSDYETGEFVTYLLKNHQTGELVELAMNGETFTYTRADGTTGTVNYAEIGYSESALFEAIFGSLDWEEDYSYTDGDYVYYNPATGEYSEESHHNYVFNEDASYEPTDCGNDGYEEKVCENCGDVQGYYYNNFSHEYEYRPETSVPPASCGESGYRHLVCVNCGEESKEFYGYTHQYEYVYSLHEGATSCEEGVDCSYVCRNCGNVAWTEEYYSFEHEYVTNHEYRDNTVYASTACGACGAEQDSEIFFEVATEETLTYHGVKNGRVLFAFTPSVSGMYQIFGNYYGSSSHDTYAALYDADMYQLIASDDDGIDMHFAILYQLEAGETYYVEAGLLGGGFASMAFIMEISMPEVITIDLSELGCHCGGTLTVIETVEEPKIIWNFNCNFGDNGVCTECGFYYYTGEEWGSGDACNEIREYVIYFGNANTDGEESRYVYYTYQTDNTNHDIEWNWNSEVVESVDENGNPIRIEKSYNYGVCCNCGHTVSRDEQHYIYDANGNNIAHVSLDYEWSNELVALYLNRESRNEYGYFVGSDGELLRMSTVSLYTYYNEDGSVSSWERTEYSYNGDDLCHFTGHYTDSKGTERIENVVSHRYTNSVWDETFGTDVDENGNPVNTRLETMHEVCSLCGAYIQKHEELEMMDAQGNLIYKSTTRYEYNSLTEALFLFYQNETYYGVHEYAEGKYFSYILSETGVQYNPDGTLGKNDTYRYEYTDGNYCSGVYYRVYEDGREEYWGEFDEHIATEEHYELHVGAESCDDGIDYVCVCLACGEELWRNEYWTYGHQMHTEYEYVDGEVSQREACEICGTGDEESESYCKVESEEELTVVTRPNNQNNYLYFEFVPTVSGFYEFYSYGDYQSDPFAELYDDQWNRLDYDDDDGDGWNFALEYELVAGETYYFAIRGGNGATVVLQYQERTTVDLSEYGCHCGGSLILFERFGHMQHELDLSCENWERSEYGYVCTDCGFVAIEDYRYKADENCNEYIEYFFCFVNVNDETEVEYVYATELTGNFSHEGDWTYTEEEQESVDAYGNPIRIVTYTSSCICSVCGNEVDRDVEIYHYDENGYQIYYEAQYYRWSAEDALLYLGETSSESWIIMTDINGNAVRKRSHYAYTYYNALGEEIEWNRISYTYQSICVYTRTETRSDGYKNTQIGYDHYSEYKSLPDESGVVESFDEYGNPITIETDAHEYYCSRCLGSLSKHVNVNVYDVNGNRIRNESRDYEKYALDSEQVGYYLINETVHTYGVFQYNDKDSVTYQLSQTSREFDLDGNVTYFYKARYDYCYEDICHYDYIRVYEDGTEYVEGKYYENHLNQIGVYRLHEGATSCEEGLDRYYVCLCCGYEYVGWENDSYYHRYNTEIDVQIIDMTPYGAVCGDPTVTLTPCVCGQRYNVEHNFHCDFDSDYNWGWDGSDTRYEYYKYTYGCAVTDPELCGFTYSVESWYTIDANCMETRYYRYTYGVNTDNPYVIEYHYATGNVRHLYSSVEISNESVTEGDLTITTRVYENVCQNCGHVNSRTTRISHTRVIDTTWGESTQEEWRSDESLYYHSTGVRVPSYSHYYEYDRIYAANNSDSTLEQVYYRYRSYDVNGDLSYTEECLYDLGWIYSADGDYSSCVTLERYQRNTNAVGEETYWSRTTYDYSTCYYTPTVTETNSDGYYDSYTNEHGRYDYSHSYWIEEPTCTQYGTEHRTCHWCDAGRDYEVSPNGHSYSYDDALEMYVCYRCDLQNFTGNDGSVWMEDMTVELGNGENYVVGYYFPNSRFEYLVTVSLVVDGIEEPIILNTLATDDGESLIYVNIAEVMAEIAEMGYSICSEMVRINIVPLEGDDYFDYAVTIDSHLPTCERMIPDGICSGSVFELYSCTLCGETVDFKMNSACSFSHVQSQGEENEEGIMVYNNLYTCRYCGYSYRTLTEVLELGNCEYQERITYQLGADENGGYSRSLTVMGKRYTQHNEVYVYTELDDGNVCRHQQCSECGLQMDGEVLITVESDFDLVLDTENQAYNAMFAFTPEVSGTYVFYSDNISNDVYATLYDSAMNYLVENDDGAGNLNFRIEIDLEAGETYYLSVCFNYHYTEEGAYTIYVEAVESAA